MADEKQTTPAVIHVFGQQFPHDDCVIVGTDLALRRLRDIISRALDAGQATAKHILTNDGEGYWLFVVRASEAQMETMTLPYSTDEPEPLPEWLDDVAGKAAQEAIHG